MTKNAFKDDFLKKGNKSRNGKETPMLQLKGKWQDQGKGRG